MSTIEEFREWVKTRLYSRKAVHGFQPIDFMPEPDMHEAIRRKEERSHTLPELKAYHPRDPGSVSYVAGVWFPLDACGLAYRIQILKEIGAKIVNEFYEPTE